ncbi:MAG: thioredoxin-disulfide reductase [Elusimicrobia bacterium RIFCSPLOWO2_02_FULL_39_32]|nr:MAG: thioredoxin-disulfide reductase [Elusimicrobia bacterium GWA2_38_7]OGR79541.1 MAG: thioredoxin-disulfide reductase [Elusimicrobia bacterium RIFCSPHIGHO2_02_FULL_39_36]OGR92867.1 MAG: thioredoxin-disulfide reductase [Elusimicrobia bacterium RIFCSPLOWO2_02_FULL_39_32]OGR99651.1 MAG: thioredoxin-disulfide reductase [Elusimicrobia bacterium RIFCSPLOWO2_12_FULL_39_28]
MNKVLIIGSGCAGYTAAIYTARANLEPLMISGVETGGQLMLTSDVENYPGFPEGILGPELMDKMKAQAERFGTKILHDFVEKVSLKEKLFQVVTSNGETFQSQTMIIATGATAQWLGIESEKRFLGKGVSACAVCDAAFYRGKEVCVVGGGDTAMEEALFLTKFASKVSLIHRRDEFRASKIMQERAKKNEKINFVLSSTVEEVFGNEIVEGVKVKNLKNGSIFKIFCKGFFVAIGHKPNTDVFKGQIQLDEKGYIITDGRTRTNVPGVFACGDVMDLRYRQAVTAAGTGCMAALEAERFLESHE